MDDKKLYEIMNDYAKEYIPEAPNFEEIVERSKARTTTKRSRSFNPNRRKIAFGGCLLVAILCICLAVILPFEIDQGFYLPPSINGYTPVIPSVKPNIGDHFENPSNAENHYMRDSSITESEIPSLFNSSVMLPMITPSSLPLSKVISKAYTEEIDFIKVEYFFIPQYFDFNEISISIYPKNISFKDKIEDDDTVYDDTWNGYSMCVSTTSYFNNYISFLNIKLSNGEIKYSIDISYFEAKNCPDIAETLNEIFIIGK